MPTPTNETDSIVRAYADYNPASIMSQSNSCKLVLPLPPEQILSFLPGQRGFVVCIECAPHTAKAQRWPHRHAAMDSIPGRHHLDCHLHYRHSDALRTFLSPLQRRH